MLTMIIPGICLHIIYYGQHVSKTGCPQCLISIYRTDKVTKKMPRRLLSHIPIIPHLQWLFMCEKITQTMDYHAWNKSEDGVLRMLADGYAFRETEEKWADFKDELHNVRLSLADDDVNPFREIRYIYSLWHILLSIKHSSLDFNKDRIHNVDNDHSRFLFTLIFWM